VLKQGKAANLCTDSSTFKLKLSETSNSFMCVADTVIMQTTSQFIEVTATKPRLQEVLRFMQVGRTRDEILANCLISGAELDTMLCNPVQWNIVGSGPFRALPIRDMFSLVDNLLVYLNADENRTQGEIQVSHILDGAAGIILSALLTAELVEFALKIVCGAEGTQIKRSLVTKFVAMGILLEEGLVDVNEFAQKVKQRVEMCTPTSGIQDEVASSTN
jgi:hypothetical protein